MASIYSAYGLCIESEIPLPEFLPGRGRPDAVVRCRALQPSAQPWFQEIGERDHHVAIERDRARFWFKDVGCFEICGGTLIEVTPIADADVNLIGLYIEGMITAMLLYQRGLCVLHASVVEIDGCAVAFLGPVGAGKSSVAAALHARGHNLISDDNAAVSLSGGAATVAPAYPYMKLYPAIAQVLGYGADDLHVMHSSLTKVAGSATRNFVSRTLPLDRLYFLRRRHPPEIQPLEASPLMLELICNSVPTRWGCAGDAEHLQRCASLAQKVSAFTVKTFDTLEEVPELARRLESHCSRQWQPPDVGREFAIADGV